MTWCCLESIHAMRTTLGGLLVLLVLGATGMAGQVILDNRSSRPLVYQARVSGQEAWAQPVTLLAGGQQSYAVEPRLVVRFQSEGRWTTAVLRPGRRFRYQEDGSGIGEIREVRAEDPGRPRERQITVHAVADEAYRRVFADWDDRIAEIVATASNYFDDALGIRLKLVRCQPWKHEAAAQGDLGPLVANLVRIEPADAELVIGWIARGQAIAGQPGWYAHSWSAPFGRHILIADMDRRLVYGAAEQLVQRLAVAFGAFYVLDHKSIMQKILENVPYPFEFGEVPGQVLLLSRDVDFRVGVRSLRPEAARQIRSLYRQHHHPSEPISEDPVSRAYRVQGGQGVQGGKRPKEC